MLLAFGLLLALLVGGLLWWAHELDKTLPPARTPAEREARNLKIFDAAWGKIAERYYDPSLHGLDWQAVRRQFRSDAAAAPGELELYVNVLTPLTDRLDDSHVYVTLPPAHDVDPGDQAARLQACGRSLYEDGLGFMTGRPWKPGLAAVVVDVPKGSGAERAGLEPGTEVIGWDISRTRCEPPRVRLQLMDPRGRRELSFVSPPQPPEPPRRAYTLPDGVRVVRFNAFQAEDAQWVLQQLDTAPAKGLVLDLRHNHGGRQRAAALVAGALLGAGKTMGTEIGRKGRKAVFSRDFDWLDGWYDDDRLDHQVRYRGPVVLLIGPASASAAEILADSLRYHRRARLIGERTSGQVMASSGYALPDGGKIHVSIMDYLSPGGGRLEEVGVRPDLQVRQTLAAIRADRDLVVEAADADLTGNRPRAQVSTKPFPSAASRRAAFVLKVSDRAAGSDPGR